MKKQRTKLLIIIVAVMAAVILVVKLKEPVSTLLQTPPPTPSATPLAQEDDGRNMYLMEEFGVACGFKYTVKDVYLTRKCGNWEVNVSMENQYFKDVTKSNKDLMDENGDLMDGYYYIVVTLEVQNLMDHIDEVNTISNNIVHFMGKAIGTSDDLQNECFYAATTPKENPNFEKYRDLFWKPEDPLTLSDTYYLWFLEPEEAVTLQQAYYPLSDETLTKVLDGTWTLAIQPIPKGGSGRAYTGPGKLGQEDQIDPEILNFDNDEKYVQTTYIKLPITKNSIRDQ